MKLRTGDDRLSNLSSFSVGANRALEPMLLEGEVHALSAHVRKEWSNTGIFRGFEQEYKRKTIDFLVLLLAGHFSKDFACTAETLGILYNL